MIAVPAANSAHPFDGAVTRCVAALAARLDHAPHLVAITVTYAQSIDGAIARNPGQPFRLSGAASMKMTHGLRAVHDTIVVGVGTVLADDPSLTVRLVPGRNPQPAVLDSAAHTPLSCRLMCHVACVRPIICVAEGLRETDELMAERCTALQAAGARILPCRAFPSVGATCSDVGDGVPQLRLCLVDVSARLRQLGYRTAMVEGGAGVIRSALSAVATVGSDTDMRIPLACCIAVTIAPRFLLEGLPLVADRPRHAAVPTTRSSSSAVLELDSVIATPEPEGGDGDIVLWGVPRLGATAATPPLSL